MLRHIELPFWVGWYSDIDGSGTGGARAVFIHGFVEKGIRHTGCCVLRERSVKEKRTRTKTSRTWTDLHE